MVVEVAPAELAPERLGPGAAPAAAPRPRAPTGSRSAGTATAATSGRRRAGRGRRRSCARRRARNALQPLARRALAARQRLGDLLLAGRARQRRHRPLATRDGSGGSSRGAPQHGAPRPRRARCGGTARRPCTAGPVCVRSSATSSTALSPGCASTRRSTPRRRARRAGARTARRRPCSAPRRRRPRAPAPAARAPARRGAPPGRCRARAATPSRSRRHSSRNCVRGPEAWRPCSSRSSRQNTGTTRSWRRGPPAARRGRHAQVAAKPEQRRHPYNLRERPCDRINAIPETLVRMERVVPSAHATMTAAWPSACAAGPGCPARGLRRVRRRRLRLPDEMLDDRATAEDVQQQVFLEVWQRSEATTRGGRACSRGSW